MLKTVIKRDGTTQEAHLEKAIGWSRWAAKGLGNRVDVPSVIRYVFSNLGEVEKTSTINKALIERFVEIGNWPALMAAGRLLAADTRKEIFPGEELPPVSQRFAEMKRLGYMKGFNYTDSEWQLIDRIVDHNRDFNLASFQVRQITGKYGIKDNITKKRFETPQYTFMRMAVTIAEPADPSVRVNLVGDLYDAYSNCYLNAPTPNYSNLGTLNNGLASCCLSMADDTAPSLAAGSLILYSMTYSSAGTGHLNLTRSADDQVRNGAIRHRGKLPYFRSDAGLVKANTQGSRGGALTEYVSVYDPEITTILQLQNPRSPKDLQNRDIHFSIQTNRHFMDLVINDEPVYFFNVKTAPELTKLFYSADREGFKKAYDEYVNNGQKKECARARDIAALFYQEREGVGTLYMNFVDEMNRHTPFKDTIYISNLCGEAMMPQAPYPKSSYLYLEEDHGQGEVALCSLGAINIALAYYVSDEYYEKLAYLAVLVADSCIDMAHYELPHLGYTAKRRRNVGIGLTGLATVMARENVRYSSPEGKALIHKIAERHAYFCIKASLRLGREKGNAPWMHKTKWPEGWLPIDTYSRAVDEITPNVLHYDWETLRQEIIANGGLRNSTVINHMPAESSSKATGSPNSLYPVRETIMHKSDADSVMEWAAIDEDILPGRYELAYDTPPLEHIRCYAVVQKHTDQGISADDYRNRVKYPDLFDDELFVEMYAKVKYGMKSSYYANSLTNKGQTEQEDTCGDNCRM